VSKGTLFSNTGLIWSILISYKALNRSSAQHEQRPCSQSMHKEHVDWHSHRACSRNMHREHAEWHGHRLCSWDMFKGHALVDEILNKYILLDCKENSCNWNILHLCVLSALCAHCLCTLHIRLFMLINMQNVALQPPPPHLSFGDLFTLYIIVSRLD
jgi:hypothetical protein